MEHSLMKLKRLLPALLLLAVLPASAQTYVGPLLYSHCEYAPDRTAVHLTWSPQKFPAQYWTIWEYRLNTDRTRPQVFTKIATVTEPFAYFEGLKPSTKYKYWIVPGEWNGVNESQCIFRTLR
jgi:hypothetical protein